MKSKSVIQKYKKLIDKLEDLRYEKMCATVDLELYISSKNMSIRSKFSLKIQRQQGKKVSDSLEKDVNNIFEKNKARISLKLIELKSIKKKIKSVHQELSNLLN